MGINFQRHYRYENETEWNKFGHTIAPKELWKQIMVDPGLTALSMTDKTLYKFPAGLSAKFLIRVESSFQVRPYGIYFLANFHFECSNEGMPNASNAILILEKTFDDALKFADIAIGTIIAKA